MINYKVSGEPKKKDKSPSQAQNMKILHSKQDLESKTDLKRSLGINKEGGMGMYLGMPEKMGMYLGICTRAEEWKN